MSIEAKLPVRPTPVMGDVKTESGSGAPAARGSNHPAVDAPKSLAAQLSPTDPTRASRAAVGPGTPALGAGGALQRPADQRVLPASAGLESRPNPSAPGADGPDYTAELEAFRVQLNDVTRSANPVRRNGHASHWIGSTLSIPTQLFKTNALAISSLADTAWHWNLDTVRQGGAGIAAALILPLTGLLTVFGKVLWGVSKLLDLPFAGLRALLARAGSGERGVARDEATHLRVAAEDWPELPTNAATNTAVRDYVANGRGYPFDVVVVPGYTTNYTEGPLSERAKERLEQAVRDLDQGLAPFIMVSGGNVHPPGTPYNEGFEMRRYLIEELGVPPDKIIVEPQADHSTTNLRNAGRYMRRFGLERALVTSSPQPFGQSFYFQSADGPFFGIHTRCIKSLGTRLGSLTRVDNSHTAFRPSEAVDLVSLAAGELPASDP